MSTSSTEWLLSSRPQKHLSVVLYHTRQRRRTGRRSDRRTMESALGSALASASHSSAKFLSHQGRSHPAAQPPRTQPCLVPSGIVAPRKLLTFRNCPASMFVALSRLASLRLVPTK